MKIHEMALIKDPKHNGGYTSIHDDGPFVERALYITDDDGNTVKLKNEQIGELYRRIKPALAA
jgi:hypothetical protein